MSTPKLYEGITMLLADPEKQFPEDSTERVNGAFVVALENFDPAGLQEEAPEDVELRDRATYIVVPRDIKITEKRFESIEVWQKNQKNCSERKLVEQAVKFLEDSGHANVRPFCLKKVTGPGSLKKEIDAAAIADNCAVVIEHKNVMDEDGAAQLADLVAFIEQVAVSEKKNPPFLLLVLIIKLLFCDFSLSYAHFSFPCSSWKDKGKGSVSDFTGKRIIGVLAGPAETTDLNNKRVMDTILHKNGFLKWFDEKGYGDDPCSSFQASGASCDAPAPSDSPGNGPLLRLPPSF
ncbi:hypothetical protein NADE_006028 [Nannochloris sp. 'desiccata']|nr:hypothetical protein NADE_006028 [Chlorella desiccata (nom. nud.)]